MLLEEDLANDVSGEWAKLTSGPAKAGALALRNFHLLQKISDEAHAQGPRLINYVIRALITLMLPLLLPG